VEKDLKNQTYAHHVEVFKELFADLDAMELPANPEEVGVITLACDNHNLHSITLASVNHNLHPITLASDNHYLHLPSNTHSSFLRSFPPFPLLASV
jgi:hypothetical protein